VTFAAVKHDARCPIDVICEILGAAEIGVQVTNQKTVDDVTLELAAQVNRLMPNPIMIAARAQPASQSELDTPPWLRRLRGHVPHRQSAPLDPNADVSRDTHPRAVDELSRR